MTAITADIRVEIERLERKHAENPEGRYFVPLANAYRKSGEIDRAIRVLRQGLGKHPDYVSAHIVLGRCFRDEGNLDAAGAEFQHVLTLDAQNLVALRILGELAAVDGNVQEARRWYGELMAVDPMNEDARQALELLGPDETLAIPEPEGAGDDETAGVSEFDYETSDDPLGQKLRRPPLAGHPGSQPEFPVFGGGESVVTETIAELYTRQGFYERAIEVYRELIRRRGDDPRLRERLERVQKLAAGEGEEVPVGPAAGKAGESPVPAAGATAAGPTPTAAGPPDPFADSFAEGFSEGRSRDGRSTEPGEARAGAGLAVAEEPTIRSFLQDVLGWTAPQAENPWEPESAAGPTAGVAAAGFTDDRVTAEPNRGATAPSGAATEAGSRLESGEFTQAPPVVEPSAVTPPPPEPAVPAQPTPRAEETPYASPLAGIADDDLFPWEIPLEADASPPQAKASPQNTAPPEPKVSFAEPRAAATPVAQTPEAQRGPAAPVPPNPAAESAVGDAPGDARKAGHEEDDDLESFQAWLRSLKR